jgi:phosphopantetheinyl transferase
VKRVRLHYLWLTDDGQPLPVEGLIEDKQIQQWLAELSAEKRHSLLRLVNPRDRLISLLALRLLKSAAIDEGIQNFHLKDICYPQAKKPYWAASVHDVLINTFDFNITHSAGLIIVAVSRDVKLGIDAERHRKLKNLNFKMVLSNTELALIEKTEEVFFDLWSKKEAVVKAADTVGVARMRDVRLHHDLAELDGKIWQIMPLDQIRQDRVNRDSGNYSIHLATSEGIDAPVIERKTIDSLL